MGSTNFAGREPGVGENVTLLVHTDDRPIWATGRIGSYQPFSIELEASQLELLQSAKSLLVLHDSGRKYSKGEGKVGNITFNRDRAWLTFADFRWEPVDTRDNPRFDVSLQTSIRSIREYDGEIQADDQLGVTKNISLGGALIELSVTLAKGQLVEFRATLDGGTTVRTMGVVAHTNPDVNVVGISFIDYIGASRYSLHQYLRGLAA